MNNFEQCVTMTHGKRIAKAANTLVRKYYHGEDVPQKDILAAGRILHRKGLIVEIEGWYATVKREDDHSELSL